MSRIIVVTGASSGLGLELYKQLSGIKDTVVCSLSRTNLNNLDHFYPCDVSSFEEVNQAMRDVFNEFGEIDVLINNAGVGISGALELLPIEEIKKIFDVNYFGVLYSIKGAFPYLSLNAKIINISSVCAFFSLPYRNVYCASKAAVNMLSYGLRMELKNTKIQVCSVCPGDIKTSFTKNRIKNHETNERYANSVINSEEKIDKNYNKRMNVEYVAKKIIKLLDKRKIPMIKIIGNKYKILYLFNKIISINCIYFVINKIFNKK